MAHIVDSSVWVGLFLDFDSNHARAATLMEKLSDTLYVPYCVVNESASVLTYKHSKEQANQFLAYLSQDNAILLIDDEVNAEINWFQNYSKKMSFTDISLLYLSKKLRAPIVTFDVQLRRAAMK